MSATAQTRVSPTASNATPRRRPSNPVHRPRRDATGTRNAGAGDDAGVVRSKTRKKSHPGRRAARVVKRCEVSVHYSVAFVLIAIAIALLAETTWALITASGPFVNAAGTAVGDVLLVLIIVEITRTVVTIPDTNGIAIRRLIVIAIVSALREVLWIGVSPALASGGTTGTVVDKSLDMGVTTAVVFGLAISFALVRRAGAKT
jgi:uncharacterized membrane protein (DUF373 family)